MLRSQILLTPELDQSVRTLSEKHNISHSEAVRRLLTTALGQGPAKSKGHKTVTATQMKLYSLNDYPQENPRTRGFRELFAVGGRVAEIKIIPESIFAYYKERKQLPTDFVKELTKVGEELRTQSLTKKLVLRRAYIVPGLDNPPGPRFVGLDVTDVPKALEQIYDFAIDNGYHTRKGSKIVAFIHPFADPQPLPVKVPASAALPYGGYAAPLNEDASRVEVFAVWGNNEGVQSFDAVDRYVVDAARGIVLSKDLPQKTVMLCTTNRKQSDKLSVPANKQFEQVLSDTEILEVGRVVRELTKTYGLRRVEFSYDGIATIVFNESAPYTLVEREPINLTQKGTIYVVETESDVKKLMNTDTTEIIVYISKKVVENRAYDILNNVAALPHKFVILYPGLSATAHAMRVLNDFGHTAIVVGNRGFIAGEEVIVRVKGAEVRVDKVQEQAGSNQVVNLYDARLFGLELVGGKAYNLSLLKTKGFNVPHGWVVTTKCFDLLAHSKDKAKLLSEITAQLPLDTNKKYAVRSSATVEDQLGHSFAGQFKTLLQVSSRDVPKAILEVMESASDPKLDAYIQALTPGKGINMAVVVQEMVDALKAGVVFGKDLQSGNDDTVVIDATRGLAEGVVDGTVKTHRIFFSRNKNKVTQENNPMHKPVIDQIELNALIDMAFNLEHLIGRIQDVEWAIDTKGTVWITQTRDLA